MSDKLISRNPDILGETPVFSGTRVPVRILMEHLEAGDRIDEFLARLPHSILGPSGSIDQTGQRDAGRQWE